jgi:hypothetical protein
MEIKTETNFLSYYQKVKTEEQWSEIIAKGNEALVAETLSNKEKSEIYAILATSSHYLGQYDQTITYATQAKEYAEHRDQSARSLYLLSAAYRSKYQQPNANNNDLKQADYWINEALKLEESPDLSPFTKAKIYFNAGALQQDIYKEPDKSSVFYLKSMSLFEQKSDDYQRTAIRYIRILVESGKTITASLEIQKIYQNIGDKSKTHVHAMQLEAKIAMGQSRYTKAFQILEQAITIAKDKNMQEDTKRLAQLKNEILEHKSKEHIDALNLFSSITKHNTKELFTKHFS